MIRITYMMLVLIALVVNAGFVCAEQKPLWEAGGGAVALINPHYPGADQDNTWLLPLPYFVYRGERVQADRTGLRGIVFNSDRLDLNMSVSGALPVNSEDSEARQGMDDLDWMLEIGPTVQYTLYQSNAQLLRVDLPVRAAFTMGDQFFAHRGWSSNPRLHYSTTRAPWKVTVTLGPVFSDRRYHGYFYDVPQRNVTADRPFYRAGSGLTGSRFSLALRRQSGNLVVGGVMQYYNLSDARNNDSPLVRRHDYLAMSVYAAWVFARSKTAVK